MKEGIMKQISGVEGSLGTSNYATERRNEAD